MNFDKYKVTFRKSKSTLTFCLQRLVTMPCCTGVGKLDKHCALKTAVCVCQPNPPDHIKNVPVQTIRWDLELCAKKAEKLLNFCQISMVSTEIRKKSGVSEIEIVYLLF